jgi:myosin tail region-interacting protein MTI1
LGRCNITRECQNRRGSLNIGNLSLFGCLPGKVSYLNSSRHGQPRRAVTSTMSDQLSSSPPQKPKPGSLRDRIAVFEKSATAPTSVGQAPPPPRAKPSGFASWKAKGPSPPSSPSSQTIDHAASPSLKASGTMSASDAKESIRGGGGSLKDRMAALQGKGAFGAPSPPLGPKPAAEKPRWKPPPAVAAPIDNHDGTGDEPSKPIAEEEATSTALSTGGGIEGSADPEEEEQQRRAAIAARMARLGGARLGMAPPVAKKPSMPIRKPTREDVPKQEDREELPKRQSIALEGNISLPPNAEQGQ